MQGLGRPSPIGLKHSAIALSGDSEPITHLHTPPARGVQGCARVCKWVQHSPLVASLRAAPATQRDRCGSPRCVDRRHTEPSAGQSGRRSGAAARNRLGDSLQVLGWPTGPILGRVCKGVQGCARVCKGCSSTAWPAPSSPSSAKCAQSDSASIGHVTGLSGYAALDLFEWASARPPTM